MDLDIILSISKRNFYGKKFQNFFFGLFTPGAFERYLIFDESLNVPKTISFCNSLFVHLFVDRNALYLFRHGSHPIFN